MNLLTSNNLSMDYFDVLASHGYVSIIDKPTRVRGTQNSMIDRVFIKWYHFQQLNNFIVQTCITDHFSVISTINDTKSNKSHTVPPNTSYKPMINYLGLWKVKVGIKYMKLVILFIMRIRYFWIVKLLY